MGGIADSASDLPDFDRYLKGLDHRVGVING
jgi:hypothetical protein